MNYLYLARISDSNSIEQLFWALNSEAREFKDKTSGYFLSKADPNSIHQALKQIDKGVRTHTFEKTWYTLDELNAKNGTSYTW